MIKYIIKLFNKLKKFFSLKRKNTKTFLIKEDFLILIRYIKSYCKIKKLMTPGTKEDYNRIYKYYNLKKEYNFDTNFVIDILLFGYQISSINKHLILSKDILKIVEKYIILLIDIDIDLKLNNNNVFTRIFRSKIYKR